MGGDESELLLGYKGRKRKNNDDSDDDWLIYANKMYKK